MQSYEYTNFIICIGPTCNLIKRHKVISARARSPNLMQNASYTVPHPTAPFWGALLRTALSRGLHSPSSWKPPPLSRSHEGSAVTMLSMCPALVKHLLANYGTC